MALRRHGNGQAVAAWVIVPLARDVAVAFTARDPPRRAGQMWRRQPVYAVDHPWCLVSAFDFAVAFPVPSPAVRTVASQFLFPAARAAGKPVYTAVDIDAVQADIDAARETYEQALTANKRCLLADYAVAEAAYEAGKAAVIAWYPNKRHVCPD